MASDAREAVLATDDILGVLFFFFTEGRRPTVVETIYGQRLLAAGASAVPRNCTYPTLRLVCRRWARVAGGLVRVIHAPRVTRGWNTTVSAFPRVERIFTGNMCYRLERAAFDRVLADYATAGRRVCIVDDRPAGTFLLPINACGHFGDATTWRFTNAALPVPAWPSKRDPARVFAIFRDYSLAAHHGTVLAQADTVVFFSLHIPVTGTRFRASAIFLDGRDFRGQKSLASHFPPENILALLIPSRWVGERVPSLNVLASAPPHAAEVVALRRLIAAVAPHPVAVYVTNRPQYEGCGFPVQPISSFYSDFT